MFRNGYIYGLFVLLIFSCKGEREERDFFKEMPEKYMYNGSALSDNMKQLYILKNGLSNTSETIKGKQYYHLFEDAEESKLRMFSGYIRKEHNAIYFLPNDYGKETTEQKLFDFNQKVGDSLLFIAQRKSGDKIKLVLKAIRVINKDSIYTYTTTYKNCDDCSKLIFFSVGVKSGFTYFNFENMSGYVSIHLTPTEIKFDPPQIK